MAENHHYSNGTKDSADLDREVIRCKVCGLVQYRTHAGNCRRCLRLMPPKVEFFIPPPVPQEAPGDERQLFEKWPNRETVENIGQRIRQLRESRDDDAEPAAGTVDEFRDRTFRESKADR